MVIHARIRNMGQYGRQALRNGVSLWRLLFLAFCRQWAMPLMAAAKGMVEDIGNRR